MRNLHGVTQHPTRRGQIPRVWKGSQQQNAVAKVQTCPDKMGRTDSVSSVKGRIHLLLCGLQKMEHRLQTWLLSNILDGIVYWLPWGCGSAHHLGRQQWLLTSRGRKTNQNETVPTSHHNLYRFVGMPFGLANAPGSFQCAMYIILTLINWQLAPVFLHNILVFSRSLCDHFEYVKRVLSLLRDTGVTLKLNRCSSFTGMIAYLGHDILPCRLEKVNHTTYAIKGLKPPTNIFELRSLLGLSNLFRRFVLNIASKAAPVNKKF